MRAQRNANVIEYPGGLTFITLCLFPRGFVIPLRVRVDGHVGSAQLLLNLEQATLAQAALERAEFTPLFVVGADAGGRAASAGEGVETGATVAHGDVLAGSAARDGLLLLLLRRGARYYCVGGAAALVCALVAIHRAVAEEKGENLRVADLEYDKRRQMG